MIVRISGILAVADEGSAVIDTGPLAYEVLVPASAHADLLQRVGSDVTLFTHQYMEGNPAQSHLTPRLLGFLTADDRAFFQEFITVRGVGMRKALRAMAAPAHQIAAAIEQDDQRSLTQLPEIGKRLAAEIVTTLRGKLDRFALAPASRSTPQRAISDIQRVAIDILVQWGDRRNDAERLVALAVEADSALTQPEDIVRAAYRVKQGARR